MMRKILLRPKVELQIPPLRYPGFPAEVGGVGECCVAGNPGSLRSG